VGLEGEALECILPAEAAYHAGSKKYTGYKDLITFGNPNGRTIGIELCHSTVESRFSDVTLESVAALAGNICEDFRLDSYRDITTQGALVGWNRCPRTVMSIPKSFKSSSAACPR